MKDTLAVRFAALLLLVTGTFSGWYLVFHHDLPKLTPTFAVGSAANALLLTYLTRNSWKKKA